MSFQITVLKVLAGHPEGRLSLDDLKRAVAILISSGPDWTDRTKRLAARAPGLDVFSKAFILRDDAGWEITAAGRAFLAFAETSPTAAAGGEQTPESIATVTPVPVSPPIRLVSVNRRRPRRWPGDRVVPYAAVAQLISPGPALCREIFHGAVLPAWQRR